MEQNETNKSRRPSALIIGGFLVVLVLLIAGLLLPPISLLQRLGLGGAADTRTAETAVDLTQDAPTTVDAAVLPDGVTLSITGGATPQVAQVAPGDFLAANPAATPPQNLSFAGDVYTLSHGDAAPTGQVALSIPAAAGDTRTLDLYGWDGSAWTFVPSQVDANAQQIVSAERALPQALAMLQVAAPAADDVAIGAAVRPEETLPAELLPRISEVTVGTLTLGANGALQGEIAEMPTGPYAQWLRVTNVGPIVDQAGLTALLSDTAVQDAHVNAILDAAVQGGFNGVHLDYQDAPAGQRAAFTGFVSKLADALRAQQLALAVSLGAPIVSGVTWDTAGQDWATLGQIADVIYVQLPLDPTAYTENGAADQLLAWATRQVDRRKLNAQLSASAVDRLGEAYTELSNTAALVNFGELQFVESEDEVEPGTSVEVALSGAASPLEWDGASLTYRYSYEQDGQTRSVWLGNEAALAQRLQLIVPHNLRGVAVNGLGEVENGAPYAAALDSYLGRGAAPQPSGAAIVWTVRDEADSVLASASGSELTYIWDVGDNEGAYTINADFALGDNIASLGSLALTVAVPVEEVAEEEPAEEPAETAPPAGTAPPTAAVTPGDADAVVNTGANVRLGPGLGYGIVSGGAQAGTPLRLIGRNDDASWFNVVLPDGQEGWIFASLVTVNSRVTVSALEVVEAPPLAPSPGGGSAAVPAPPPPAPIGNVGSFELGGQSAGLPAGTMQYAGMTWIKRQHKWSPGNTGQDVAGLITEGRAAGFKVLLSIPGELNPSSIDFNAYVNFLGQVAALPTPPDAIEVWNEMNITREWPPGQINPQAYVTNMLAPAYRAIKAANPNIMVITGAPAPTGFFGGACGGSGCDDAPYIAGMMAAGAGSYSDCIGVHYNEGILPPAATSGDPRGNGGHYTRYFQGMINAYTAAGAGQLCFTELGYLSGEEWGFVPSGFLWKAPYNLTVAQHAQYLAESVSVAVNSGRVRMIIVFNVDFTTWGDDPQAGYAMIRPGGSCPACETLRRVMGR